MKKDKKYFERKIENLERKMDNARSELLGVGTEMLRILDQEEKYEATITDDGLTFVEKGHCDYVSGLDEISAPAMLCNFEETENEK